MDFDLESELKKYKKKKVPIELAILRDLRATDFKIVLDDKTELAPSDLLKYKITLQKNVLNMNSVHYAKYNYFIPFDKNTFDEYELQMLNPNGLPVNLNASLIKIKDGRTYNIKHFFVNIDLLNKKATQVYVPQISSSGKIVAKKAAIPAYEPSNQSAPTMEEEEVKLSKSDEIKARENQIEMMEVEKASIEDLIWYLRQKSNNRKLDEFHIKDVEAQLELYDKNYLYEDIFLNSGNYSTSAVALLFCMIPLFYTYPRFYQLNTPLLLIGFVGILLCMNIIQNKYALLFQNKQLVNIYIGVTVLFYFIFFICMNQLNHMVLFFLSAAIVFMAMNYILRILASDPKRGFGFHRLQYNAQNSTYTPFNQRIEKVCTEVKRRYKLQMDVKQLYMYMTSYEVVEKSTSFVTTEFVCNIIQPLLGVIVLYLMGGILNKKRDFNLLKSITQLLQERELKQADPSLTFEDDEKAFHTIPLVGFTELSQSICNNSYNYFLPKELNAHFIMEKVMDEVDDKIIQPKSAHAYEKSMLKEKIQKKLDREFRNFLQFIQDQYLPVCIRNPNDPSTMNIQSLRKDNRYNPYDGSYNQVHDVLERYGLLEIRTNEIESYFANLWGEKDTDLITRIQEACKEYVYHGKDGLEDAFYKYVYEKELGSTEYEKKRSIMKAYQIQMESIMRSMEASKKILSTLPENDPRRNEYQTTYQEDRERYEGVKSVYDEVVYLFESLRSKYQTQMKEGRDILNQYMNDLQIHLKENLFVSLIQSIEENRKESDLNQRNQSLNRIQYKFKDIYDFITNEELFSPQEQTTFMMIIEDKMRSLFGALYTSKVKYDPNHVLFGNMIPESVKAYGNKLFSYILQAISTWILLGKILGSGWFAGKMAMSDIQNDYTEIMRNYEYDGHFSSIWKICSMGVDKMYMEKTMDENQEVLKEKMESMNPLSRMYHYVGAFFLFILLGIFLNAYNNSVFGMAMYPLWTNLPGVILLILILGVIYYLKK